METTELDEADPGAGRHPAEGRGVEGRGVEGRSVEGLRTDGFAPIEAYGAIGDGRSVALVALDGSIDWWTLPTMDAPPAFAAIVDPDGGGAIRLRPRADATVRREYVGHSTVLATSFTTDSGTVRVTDSLNLMNGQQMPWSELCRTVEGGQGRVEMEWEVEVGHRFGMGRPWATMAGGMPLVTIADQNLGVILDGAGTPEVDGHVVRGSFSTEPGSRHVLAIVSTDGEPLFVPDAGAVAARVEETLRSWKAWSQRVHYDGPWADAVRASARALKLLVYSPTGAIAAAPTTSLPEAIGGSRNYDYRFAWVRDMSFVIQSLVHLGLHEDSHRSLSWLVSTVRRTAPDLHVFYSLDGRLAEGESEIAVPGYRDSRPVLAGNGAAGQTQLGTYGDLLDAIWGYARRGNLLDDATAKLVADCADRVCDEWHRKDSGIWELDENRHYTSSKMACWAALDRACRLAEQGQVVSRNCERWDLERDGIQAWVREHCWSPAKSAYTFYAGTDRLDAAVLHAARMGFDRGPRMSSTIDAVRAELARGPLVHRYSGMADEEGAFVACCFWVVEALAFCDRREEAAELMDQLVELPNDVGLLAEEIDPDSGAFLGNFPLGLSHLAVIGAATALAHPAEE